MPPSSPSKPTPPWKASFAAIIENISDDPGHPLQIALRTFSLCLSLSLSPVLLRAIFALVLRPESFTTHVRVLWRALSRELRPTGFASAITTAVGGGAALQRLWNVLEHRHINSKLSLYQRTFLANALSSTFAIILLRWKRYRRPGTVSPTLDLSLLFFVRALDASVQLLLLRKGRERQVQAPLCNVVASRASSTPPDTRFLDKQSESLAKEWQNKVAMHLDTFVFWAGSARIMWCFLYQPQRLPPTFVKWINSLANIDKRLLEVLRALREGTWSYARGSKHNIVGSLAEELGRSSSWADPAVLPAYGGNFANDTWKQLGVEGRSGIGGMPCEIVHGGIGASFGLQNDCVANTAIRTAYVFAQALALYLPVHFLPILLTKPSSIIRPHLALSTLLSAIRSATFLSTFISSCWFTVCFTRTLVLARLFPNDFARCLGRIWIEDARRRREVALYVLPRALRASIPEKWLRSRHSVAQFAECLTFIVSLASLLTFSVHHPESLRGLLRWTMAFVMKGPNAGVWKKKIVTCPPTPVEPSTPPLADHKD
ncbi:hypothetical protein EV363DRAFT_1426683 [Boletus edulis]|nr:hypothetical protein EV363DRAFT_1426683 [Boletus edulis]